MLLRYSTLALCANLFPLVAWGGLLFHQSDKTLLKRAEDAGIGIELENRGLAFLNEASKATQATPDQTKDIKAKKISTTGKNSPAASTDEWALTAEFFGIQKNSGVNRLVAEFIVDGLKVKLGSKKLASIGKEMTAFLDKWQPSRKDATKVNVEGYERFGEWSVTEPSIWNGAASTLWGLQVTVPMPLEATYNLMLDLKKSGKENEILKKTKKDAIHVVGKDDFRKAGLTKITSNADDVLGFFSLVISYAKATKRMIAEQGPKQSISIMPRTDFAAIYGLVEDKIKPQYQCKGKDKDEETLYTIVKKLAEFEGDGNGGKDKSWSGNALDGQKFKWDPLNKAPVSGDDDGDGAAPPALPTPPAPPAPKSIPPPPPLPTKRPGISKRVEPGDLSDLDLAGGTLTVEKWLNGIQNQKIDYIAAMETKLRYGQVGSLGSKMEYVLGSSRAVPIFEFRDIPGISGGAFQDELGKIEAAVESLHKRYKKRSLPASVIDRRAPPPAAPKPSDDVCSNECPRGQARTGPDRKCQNCPNGKIPSADGNTCEDKCPDNQAKTGLNGKCETCPKGQGPTIEGDKCEDKCPDGQAKTGMDGKCEKCPDGKEPSAAGDTCEDKCADGQAKTGAGGKCENCPDGKKPSPNGKTCENDPDGKCPDGQAKTAPGGKCEKCPDGKKPSPDGKTCDGEDTDKCPDGQAKTGPGGKCDKCPPGQKPNAKGDGCDDPKKDEREKKKKEFEDQKTTAKNSGSKGFRGAGALALGAGIAELLKLIPSGVPWDYKDNIDVCALTLGTKRDGGGCFTSVSCQIQVNGNDEVIYPWNVCYKGGVQYFTDDRIGDFSVEFTEADADCNDGLCRPIIKMQNWNNWMPLDAQKEADVQGGGNGNLCHRHATDLALDGSENNGDKWWVCGVPNL